MTVRCVPSGPLTQASTVSIGSIVPRSASSRGPLGVVAPLGLLQLPGQELAVRLGIRLHAGPQPLQVGPFHERAVVLDAPQCRVARGQERFDRAGRRGRPVHVLPDDLGRLPRP